MWLAACLVLAFVVGVTVSGLVVDWLARVEAFDVDLGDPLDEHDELEDMSDLYPVGEDTAYLEWLEEQWTQ